jgi:phenylpropionate dioxygenase-like ring-hydroxylating dioxygenase large terminal subunit
MSVQEIDQKVIIGSRDLERCPFPIPIGWFFVAYSDSLAVGEVRNIELFDQEWVLFRGESGKVGVTDPFCPHLGAHLGHGGVVVGDNIRCPFHHWEYNADGWCKKIPYATNMPPITQRQPILRTLPTQEKYGLIWAWHHPNLEAPTWDLPEIEDMASDEYVKPMRKSWPINTAIQEIAENGVDFPHLKFLHGGKEIPHADYRFDGHKYFVNMDHGAQIGESHGPGLNIFRFTNQGVSATMVSYSQPINRELTMINMSFTHKKYPEGTKEAQVAHHIVKHMIGEAEGEDSAGFESVDLIVWNNKKYRARPILCDGDGPILQYRAWFKKFYVDGDRLNNI